MLDERRDRWSAATRAAPVLRVVLADDHLLVRAGLRALLERDAGMQVVAEASDGREAVTRALDLRPDVVVMDLAMTGLNGVEATRQIIAARPEARVLCLSMHADEQFVAAAFQAGAAGYVLKDCAPDELLRAIRVVAAKQTYLSPAVAGSVVLGFTAHRSAGTASPFSQLSDREREVLQLIAEGNGTKQIAGVLGVSVKTVASHRERIQHKLNVQGVAGLTRYALTHGLIATPRARVR